MHEELTKRVYYETRRLVETEMVPRVLEVKHRQDGKIDRTACSIVAEDRDHAFLYHRLKESWQVGPIDLTPPLFTLAYYPNSKSYNIYWWVDDNGTPVAAYFNIVSSDGFWLRDGELHFEDRVLDILMTPDGQTTLLDEEELWLMNHQNQSLARAEAARVLNGAVVLLGRAVAEMAADIASPD